MKTNTKAKDIKKVAKREAYFSTLAKKEGKEAAKRAIKERKEHMPESAKDSARESKIAMRFAAFRKQIAEQEKAKLKNRK